MAYTIDDLFASAPKTYSVAVGVAFNMAMPTDLFWHPVPQYASYGTDGSPGVVDQRYYEIHALGEGIHVWKPEAVTLGDGNWIHGVFYEVGTQAVFLVKNTGPSAYWAVFDLNITATAVVTEGLAFRGGSPLLVGPGVSGKTLCDPHGATLVVTEQSGFSGARYEDGVVSFTAPAVVGSAGVMTVYASTLAETETVSLVVTATDQVFGGAAGPGLAALVTTPTFKRVRGSEFDLTLQFSEGYLTLGDDLAAAAPAGSWGIVPPDDGRPWVWRGAMRVGTNDDLGFGDEALGRRGDLDNGGAGECVACGDGLPLGLHRDGSRIYGRLLQVGRWYLVVDLVYGLTHTPFSNQYSGTGWINVVKHRFYLRFDVTPADGELIETSSGSGSGSTDTGSGGAKTAQARKLWKW